MKGILFKEEMFRAIIEGKKTQTRRIIKPQQGGLRTTNVLFEDFHGTNYKPRYKVGEIVYLKEPYIDDLNMDAIYYKYEKSDVEEVSQWLKKLEPKDIAKLWKNKLFMPESVARYFIQITGVCSERVGDISNDDIIKEGAADFGCCTKRLNWQILWDSINGKFKKNAKDGNYYRYPFKEDFAYSMDIGKKTCISIPNPWVWVYDFKLTF